MGVLFGIFLNGYLIFDAVPEGAKRRERDRRPDLLQPADMTRNLE
jgi:hypothetical protein